MKHRLTVSVDPEVVAAANQAVTDGRAESVSAWVNGILLRQAFVDSKLAAARAAIEWYESEHGPISQEEIEEQRRLDKEAAARVRAETLARMGAEKRKRRRAG